MDATRTRFEAAGIAEIECLAPDSRPGPALRWSALQDAAAVVARLAGVTRPPHARDPRAALERAQGWRRQALGQALDDLCAIMEPGIAALLAVRAAGGDARVPALALWREYEAAERGLLAMLSPPRDRFED